MSWGQRGKGRWITVYTNPGHAYMVVAGLRLDTQLRRPQPPQERASGTGPRWRKYSRKPAGFTARHPARALCRSTRRRLLLASRLRATRAVCLIRVAGILRTPRRTLKRPPEPDSMAVAVPATDKTDEQKAITDMVRQFADEQILPNAEHYDHEDEFPEPIVEQMKELGLFGVTIPEEYGGMGLDLTTYAMIVEELSRGWISISGIVNTHFIGSYLLMKFGTDEQKEKYLPRMATGEIRAAFSLSEPELGSDVQAIKTPAKKVDDGNYEINGQKMWVTNGLRSALVFVLVKTDPDADPRHKGMTCFIAEKEPGAHENDGRLRRLHRAAAAQEDGLQGRRVHRAGLRRLQVPRREHPRRRGRRPEQGLRADDGRARGRPRERGRPRRGHRPARAGAGAALLAGAQDVRQADRRAPGDPVQARRHGHPGRGRAAADADARRG